MHVLLPLPLLRHLLRTSLYIRYLGEWYVRDEPYPQQRDKAVHSAWLVSGIYGVLAVVCGVIFSYHTFRPSGYQKM